MNERIASIYIEMFYKWMPATGRNIAYCRRVIDLLKIEERAKEWKR